MNDRFYRVRTVVLKTVVLAAVFVVSAWTFSRMINKEVPETERNMAESTFPLVYMRSDGIDFNCLHGFCREMDVREIRDALTPLSDDHSIGIRIDPFGKEVDDVSYEVLTTDGTSSLENTKVVKLSSEGGSLVAQLELLGKMYMNREYMLKIAVDTGGKTVYYYTRIVLADGLHTKDYLTFVSGFYDKCINKSDLNTIAAAVEPDDTTDEEQTLAYMDIHDSVDQLTWGKLHPQIYYKPTPRLTEINQNTATLTTDYRIASVSKTGRTQLYNVHEYYRVRFTDSRVFLLNFERTAGQIFDPEDDVLTENGILLGVTGRDIDYTSDSTGRMVAFVQEDALWTYGTRTGILSKVFSFPQDENMDERDFYKRHSIRVLRVSEKGDVWFAVGGYMNRGAHEGDTGVALYHYDGLSAALTELTFLETDLNIERIEKDMNSCLYLTEDGSAVFLMLDGIFFKVNLKSGEMGAVGNGIRAECYAGSDSGRYFAYLKEGEPYQSRTICVRDFETDTEREVTCGDDEYARPLVFMGDDLVYGVAKTSQVDAVHSASSVFPMKTICIQDSDGNTVKTYEASGTYVTSVSLTDSLLSLSRVTLSPDGVWTEAPADEIVSTAGDSSVEIGPATTDGGDRQTLVLLRVGSDLSGKSSQIVSSVMNEAMTSRTVELPQNPEQQDFCMVYAKGRLWDIRTYVNDAVAEADEMLGVAVSRDQKYIWVRGDSDVTADIPDKDLPAVVRSGISSLSDLESGVNGKTIDLTGCTLEEVLYFVSHGSAVMAKTDEGMVAIVGYDEYNTHILKPGAAEWEYYGMNDSTELFQKNGNVFYSYLES